MSVDQLFSRTAFNVILEWDGSKPPTTFYKRLHQLGIRVRGDKKLSPIARRAIANATDEDGRSYGATVTAQEGSIICASESLAHLIASIAVDQGAKNVHIAETIIKPFRASIDDIEALASINAIFGRRGRPSAETFDFCVTCFEQAATFAVNGARYVAVCPSCGGTMIRKRIGLKNSYRPIKGGESTASFWLNTRFSSGKFEVPEITPLGEEPESVEIDYIDPEEIKGVQAVLASSEMQYDLSIMDKLFISRAHTDPDRRLRGRIAAITEAIKLGMPDDQIDLLGSDTRCDPFDLACVIGAASAVQEWTKL
jgi:hypothetical protein